MLSCLAGLAVFAFLVRPGLAVDYRGAFQKADFDKRVVYLKAGSKTRMLRV